MRNWPANEGSEAMVRLRNGRFIVLAEGKPGSTPPISTGLLFAGDPVDEAEAETFLFPRQSRYRPTDMALLPDGRCEQGPLVELLRADLLARVYGCAWREVGGVWIAD